MIPESLRNTPIVRLAQGAGWDIDGGFNGIFLPRAAAQSILDELPVHNGWSARHAVYNQYVRGLLNDLSARAAREGWAPQQAAKALDDVSRKLTDDIVRLGGGVPINRP
ncbi:AHH domain-containing protein [Calidithermus chliarophilus]|uniref:AHH domain-containing protein n=1 Tax=Calidithermus chliarophilus TaxID=52023 RepID=UPI000A0028F7